MLLWNCSDNHSVTEIELNENWSFKKVNDTQWKEATVPGTVHTDLIASGEIAAPFYRLNERDIQWIDKVDWG